MAGKKNSIELPADLAELPAGWDYAPLGNLTQKRGICYGIVQPGQVLPDGVPVIRVNNIRGGVISDTDVMRVHSDIEANYERSRLKGGEVLLTLVGTLGEVAVVPDRMKGWNVARAVGVIPVAADPGNRWVSICLRSEMVQRYIQMWATTTVQATFNLRDVARLPIPIPPEQERTAIAHILGTLDDKLELNRQMNQTLEAMARAIFQSWFVDFDPVRAKMDGRQPEGLDAATAALFPDALEHTDAGPVPQSWRACRWGDIATLEYGKSLRGYQDAIGTVRVYGTNGPIGWHSEALCNSPGIIIGRKGAYRGVHYSPSPFYVIDTAFYLAPAVTFDLKWAYYELLALDINSMDSGSAIPSTSREDFYAVPLCLPSTNILKAFGDKLQPLCNRQLANEQESETLAALRDTLLPKLLSGEIRVGDAERLVGDVT